MKLQIEIELTDKTIIARAPVSDVVTLRAEEKRKGTNMVDYAIASKLAERVTLGALKHKGSRDVHHPS